MAGVTYAKHTQTVYLKADEAPPFPQSIRHWIVSSIENALPGVDPKENEAYLATLPDRIVTVPMLHHSYRSLVVTILLLVWTYAFCCRFPRARARMARLGIWFYGLLVLSMLPCAYLDRLGLYMSLLSAAAALCGKPLDALAPLAVLTWAQEGWTITAIGSTAAYLSWAMDSLKTIRLPDFETFFDQLRPAASAPEISQEDEERGCLVCWSSEDPPLQLPCHKGHTVCKGCLLQLYEADKYRCPFCRKSLYIYKSRAFRIFLRHLIVAGTVVAFAFRLTVLALQLYKGYYFAAAKEVFLSTLYSPVAWFSLFRLRREWPLANTKMVYLWIILALTARDVWSLAAAVQKWDQVVLWDGAVLEGVKNTYAVVREQYVAVG